MKSNYFFKFLFLFSFLFLAGCAVVRPAQKVEEAVPPSASVDACAKLVQMTGKADCEQALADVAERYREEGVQSQLDQILGSGDRTRCAEFAETKDQEFCRNQFPLDLKEPTEKEEVVPLGTESGDGN